MEKNELIKLNNLIESLNAEKAGVRLFKDKLNTEYAMIRSSESTSPYVVDRVDVFQLEGEDWKNVAFFNFTAKPSSYIFLWNIEITDESVLNRGIGKRMFDYFQEIGIKSRCKTIEGNYYPKGKQDPEKTKQFYLRNGCSIDKEGYSTVVYKYIQFEKFEPTTKDSEGFECYGNLSKSASNVQQDERSL